MVFGAQADSDLPWSSTSKNKQYGIYIQDDWAVNEHLTLNLGVRYDYEETPTYTDFVTPQRFLDSINGLDTNACALDPYRLPLPCQYYFSGGYHGAQPGQTYAETLANRRHRHQRLHQHRQQPQEPERSDRSRGSASPMTSTPISGT